MRVDEFDFELPADRIAQRPAAPRDSARLLHIAGDALENKIVRDLPGLLTPGDLLVFNDTRVIPARLAGMRGEAKVSVTLHQALSLDTWRVFAKPAKRLKAGDMVVFREAASPSPRPSPAGAQSAPQLRNATGGLWPRGEGVFCATVLEKSPEGDVTLQFDRGGADLMQALHAHGAMPLPPYIRGGVADAQDQADYQTLFARAEGAVAAPTAALHFTPGLMDALAARGVKTAMLTLHVGAGTFLPVKVDDTADHKMHAEVGILDAATADTINATRSAGGRIVAVGTTSLRLLESAAADDGTVRPFTGATSIFITPGYRFKTADMLLTNFHLPRSTLFMLVAAFAGLDRMKAAYAHAVAARYRFYSYGDCCLLSRDGKS